MIKPHREIVLTDKSRNTVFRLRGDDLKYIAKKVSEMAFIEYRKNVPLYGEYDVCVLGGGPAGVCAAVEAARCGRSVLLCEATGMLGGMATSALVGPFMTCYDRKGEQSGMSRPPHDWIILWRLPQGCR